MPTQSLPRLESLGKGFLCLDRSERRLKRSRHERGAVVVRHRERLFLAEVKFLRWGVVRHVPAGGLSAQPFANVAFRRPRAFRQFCSALRTARRKAFVQTKLVADANQRRVKRRAKIDQRSSQKLI